MNPEQIKETVVSSFREVLETMAFLEVEAEPYAVGNGFMLKNALTGLLGFSGGLKGTLALNCSEGFARTATASLLGIEEKEVGEAQFTDTVKELTNMAAGGIFFRLDGENTLVKLGIPELRREGVGAGHAAPGPEVWIFPFSFNSLAGGAEVKETVFIEIALETIL